MIIWMMRYQISFSTSAFLIRLTTTSTYHLRFSANFSARMAIFSTRSSRMSGSFLFSKYPKSWATISEELLGLQIRYNRSNDLLLIEISASYKFAKTLFWCFERSCLRASLHMAYRPKYLMLACELEMKTARIFDKSSMSLLPIFWS